MRAVSREIDVQRSAQCISQVNIRDAIPAVCASFAFVCCGWATASAQCPPGRGGAVGTFSVIADDNSLDLTPWQFGVRGPGVFMPTVKSCPNSTCTLNDQGDIYNLSGPAVPRGMYLTNVHVVCKAVPPAPDTVCQFDQYWATPLPDHFWGAVSAPFAQRSEQVNAWIEGDIISPHERTTGHQTVIASGTVYKHQRLDMVWVDKFIPGTDMPAYVGIQYHIATTFGTYDYDGTRTGTPSWLRDLGFSRVKVGSQAVDDPNITNLIDIEQDTKSYWVDDPACLKPRAFPDPSHK